ncbi:GntR family transcriptional regulator [Beijerinckia indica]|uniref:Transcriptional regulator, GntR family n=1 Tax=Beijerinckia indica subsp. indica (strain ATCC 9039 / DSM 1715 / NCIMB 8712) TaxID=395963 RepID=B2IGR6_BEII9|nr:GntR family transcriptional regulator [Beijerinckia indica]ACB95827.1 transcriptional regulator, GntR family [Beijerinckia indica subsp. indica ATCC 9039]
MAEPTPIFRQSLHDVLTPSLRQLILGGELKPGEKIPERQLCERFGVSRTPLREALKVLAAEGLIELLPQRGAIVAQISPEDIEELFPIMAALEALAGELACERATDADIAQVRALHGQMMESYRNGDEDDYLRLNRRIHQTIFDIAHNETLAAMYQQILTRMHSHRFIVRKSEANWKSAVEEHEKIMEALAARDKRRLPSLLRKHVTGTTVRIATESVERTRV